MRDTVGYTVPGTGIRNYAAIPAVDFDIFQRTIGMFTNDCEVAPIGTLTPRPDERVVLVGGLFQGCDARFRNTENDNTLYHYIRNHRLPIRNHAPANTFGNFVAGIKDFWCRNLGGLPYAQTSEATTEAYWTAAALNAGIAGTSIRSVLGHTPSSALLLDMCQEENLGQVVDTVGTEHCGFCRTHGCEKAKTENVGCKPQFTTK